MIVDSSDAFGNATHVADDSAEIGMEPFLPFKVDERMTFFGAEYDVVMKTQMG